MLGLYLAALCLLGSATALPRGVDPAKADAYSGAGDKFTCLDGSATIPFSRVNDNYCDCGDGSDEPGTSACYYGVFYCRNKGHQPQVLSASFVDDGICDCCDGTDEKPSVGCKNTCLEKGAHERDAVRQKAKDMERSLQLKQQLIEQSVKRKADWSTRASELPMEVSQQEHEITRLEGEKTAAQKAADEDRKRLQDEAEEKRKQEAAAQAAQKAAAEAAAKASQQDATQAAEDEDREETAEERGRRIAAQWTTDPDAAGLPGQQEVNDGGAEEDADDHHTEYSTPAVSGQPYDADSPASAPAPATQRPVKTTWDFLERQWNESVVYWRKEQDSARFFWHAVKHVANDVREMVTIVSKGGMMAYRQHQHEKAVQRAQERAAREQEAQNPELQAQRELIQKLLKALQEPGMDPQWQEEGRRIQAEWYLASATGQTYSPTEEQRALLEKVAQMQAEKEQQAAAQSATAQAAVPAGKTGAGKPVEKKRRRKDKPKTDHYTGTNEPAPAPYVYTPLDNEVTRINAQLDSAKSRLTQLREELDVVSRYHTSGIQFDYGPNNTFLSLAGRCVAETNQRWKYEACFFSHATQSEPHNLANKVSLGTWGRWENDYTEALFFNGDPCQGAPNRSFTVRLVCGEHEQMWGGEEPSTCVYTAWMSTPLACRQSDLDQEYAKLAELEAFEAQIRAEIAAEEKERASQTHDEL